MAEFFSCCRLQIGCLVFLLYIGFLSLRLADKDDDCNVFADLLYVVGEICVVFDALTAWSVNSPHVVPWNVNLVLHGIFYILLELELWLMYFYFRSIAGRLPDSLGQKIFFGVLAVSLMTATLLLLPSMRVVHGERTNYSYGAPVFIVFSMVPMFLFFIVVFGRKYVLRADPLRKLTFGSCFFAVLFFTLIQLIFPESLVSSLNVSLIVVSVALNSENPVFHKLERITRKYEMEKKYYDRLDEIEQRQAIIRHDEKHYLAAIGGLCAEGKTEEIEKLLKVMNIELQKNTPRKYVRNRIVNALFNEKETLAGKEQVAIDFQIEPEVELVGFEDIDLIAMFGNMIDNAVRAESEWQESKGHRGTEPVSVKLFETDGNFIMFIVENHYRSIEMANGRLVSTKKLPGQHGLGLMNIKSLCEKYGGVFDMESSDDIFVTSICLPKSVGEISNV
ncbi:MAG: sensor histidine kinase [Treponema sp.]|nr:sensor histidine kinase [Candidatus Treponema equi]